MVPRDVIDEIRNRVDIVRLIGEAVPLKKSGRNYLGICPFHKEKSPSFNVSEQKQLYHCFGCAEGGTVITFLMKFHRLNFPEALERLASVAGVDLSKYKGNTAESAARQEERKRLLRIVSYARDVYHRSFTEAENAEGARTYASSRGISFAAAKRLRLGYAPEGWDTLVRALERDRQSLEEALLAGVIGKRQSSKGYFDLFRNRLLFPISDPQGQTVGFGGRILGKDPRGDALAPKYLNSPQTPIFDKGRLLYGIHEASESIRAEKKAIVVEGYMDQVALVEAGISNVVATLGTALTFAHARLLRQYADEVIVLFDGDTAGLKASRRSIRPLLSEGVKAFVGILPEGVDPDVFVRKNGKEALANLIREAAPILDFFIERFYQGAANLQEKAAAIEELAGTIKETNSVYLKEALIDEAAKKTGLDREILRGERRMAVPAPQRSTVPAKPISPSPRAQKEELILLRLAAEVGKARERFVAESVLSMLSSPELGETAQRWLAKVSELEGSDNPAAQWVDSWDDEETRPLLAGAFLEGIDVDADWERVWNDCLRKVIRRAISKLTQQIPSAERAAESGVGMNDVRMDELNRKIFELKQMEQAVNRPPRIETATQGRL